MKRRLRFFESRGCSAALALDAASFISHVSRQNFKFNIEIYSIIFTAKEIVLELHFATVFHEIVCEKER